MSRKDVAYSSIMIIVLLVMSSIVALSYKLGERKAVATMEHLIENKELYVSGDVAEACYAAALGNTRRFADSIKIQLFDIFGGIKKNEVQSDFWDNERWQDR